MELEFKVTCSVEFESGKFASGDEVADEIVSSLESADPGSMQVNEGNYNTSDWNVEQVTLPSRRQVKHARRIADAKAALATAIEAIALTEPTLMKALNRLKRLTGGRAK